MTTLYLILGLTLSFLVGLLAVRYENKQSTKTLATNKLPYLKFLKFISSWQVFFALFIPSVVIDYVFYEGRAEFFFWFLIIYGGFITPLSFKYTRLSKAWDISHSAGKTRHEAYESGDEQRIIDQRKRDQSRYILTLVIIALGLLYGFFK